MKDSYNKTIQLQCIACGSKDFDFNDDKTWLKCTRCEKEYNGGYDELVELNQELINRELEKTKEEVGNDIQKDISDMFKKAFK